MVESEKTLSVKEEELKNNEIDLVARTEWQEKAQAEIGLLKRELARLYEESRSLKLQLKKAKATATAANAVSEYQSSEEMAELRQTLHDETYEEVAKAFTYTTATTHSEWDLAYLKEHLVDQIAKWRAQL